MSCRFNCLLGLTHNSRSAYFYIKAVLPLGCDGTVKPLLTVGRTRPAQLSIEPESNKALASWKRWEQAENDLYLDTHGKIWIQPHTPAERREKPKGHEIDHMCQSCILRGFRGCGICLK